MTVNATLSNVCITQAMEQLQTYLETTTLGHSDCIRTVLVMEEALLYYQSNLGEDTSFTMTYGAQWGRAQFSITLRGVACNPLEASDDDAYITQHLIERMGLFPSWRYQRGCNVLSMVLPKIPSSGLKKLGIAVAAAFLCYAIALLVPESVRLGIYTYGVTPLSDVFTGLLNAISGPLIFCSIACSITNMGDISTFGKIGKHTILALLGSLSLVTFVSGVWLLFLYPPSITSGVAQEGNTFFQIYELFLDVFPTNLLGAFVDSNPMQIVAMSVVFGISLLALQKKAEGLASLTYQCNMVLQYVMELLASVIHIFVFLSVLGLLLSDQISMLLDGYLVAIYLLIGSLICVCISVGKACVKTGVSPKTLVKKTLPTALLSLSTASSSASFSTNLNCCKKELGIPTVLAEFGVPLGQVLYMPAFSISLWVFGFVFYDSYDMDMTISAVGMLLFLSVILSIALPPIPGGPLVVINIFFLQMGIPTEGLALAIIFSTLYDFPATAMNVSSLQMELVCIAQKLGMLDEDMLKDAGK